MRIHRRAGLAILGVAAALVIAACTPNGQIPSGEMPSELTSDATASDGTTSEPPVVETPATPAPLGALDEIMSRISVVGAQDTLQDEQAFREAEQRHREEFLAACMAEQGFTYLPRLNQTVTVVEVAGPEWGSREFAEQFGLGVSTAPSGLPGRSVISGDGIDPNQEYLAAMSEAEREAFDYALTGDWLSLSLDVVTELWEAGELSGRQGCWGRASDAWWQPAQNDEFAAIENEVVAFWNAIEVNPQLLVLDNEWAACLAEAGFAGQQNPAQLRWALQEEWAFIQDGEASMEIVANWDWAAEPEGPPGWIVGEDGVGTLVMDAAAEANFREREWAIALADADCRASLDFAARQLAINHQLQQEFVDQHRDELEAWATYAEQSRQFS